MNNNEKITFWGIIGAMLVGIGFVLYRMFYRREFPWQKQTAKHKCELLSCPTPELNCRLCSHYISISSYKGLSDTRYDKLMVFASGFNITLKVCAWCGKLQGFKHGGIGITHGICNDCVVKYFPDTFQVK